MNIVVAFDYQSGRELGWAPEDSDRSVFYTRPEPKGAKVVKFLTMDFASGQIFKETDVRSDS